MDINIDGVVTWLKNWFYDKTEITGFLNNKANQSDLQTTNGNLANLSSTVDNKVDKITGKGLSTEDFTTALKDKLDGIEAQANKTTVDSALSSTSTNPLQNKAINSALSGKASTSHAHYIGNSSSDNGSLFIYPNGDGQNPAHLGAWLHALEAEVDNLTNLDLVEIVTTLPTASSETMNKLYLVAKSSGSTQDYYDIYITVQHENNGNYTYAWEKIDDFDLQNLSIGWGNVTNKPSTFRPSSHTQPTDTITNDILYDNFPQQSSQAGINNSIDTWIGNFNTSLTSKGALTDDIDWTYSSNGFTNGVKLVSKTDNANGRITLHLKS